MTDLGRKFETENSKSNLLCFHVVDLGLPCCGVSTSGHEEIGNNKYNTRTNPA